MEITITTKQILKVLYILSWIIFIGVCVDAGGTIFNAFFALVLDSANSKYFWNGVDLNSLYNYDHGFFAVTTFFMGLVAIMKAFMFYLIIKILDPKKLNIAQPFTKEVGRLILGISYLTLFIGAFSLWGIGYTEWLTKKGIQMPDIRYLGLGGADVWLFMAVTLFVIAQVYKRGIEIQDEHELTV